MQMFVLRGLVVMTMPHFYCLARSSLENRRHALFGGERGSLHAKITGPYSSPAGFGESLLHSSHYLPKRGFERSCERLDL